MSKPHSPTTVIPAPVHFGLRAAHLPALTSCGVPRQIKVLPFGPSLSQTVSNTDIWEQDPGYMSCHHHPRSLPRGQMVKLRPGQ